MNTNEARKTNTSNSKTETEACPLDAIVKYPIVFGDCLKFMAKMPKNSVDLLITDPPYGINFQSGHRNKKWRKIANDNNLLWLTEFSAKVRRVLKPGAHAYIFCSHHHGYAFRQIIGAYLPYKNKLIWKKNNTGMGDIEGDYAPQYEEILFFSNGEKKLNGRRDSNILEFVRTQNELHPTQKPVDLIRFLIRKSTDKGDLVFDPFLGSGTTAIAAHQEKREFIGIELDEVHFKTAKKRYEQFKSQQTLF